MGKQALESMNNAQEAGIRGNARDYASLCLEQGITGDAIDQELFNEGIEELETERMNEVSSSSFRKSLRPHKTTYREVKPRLGSSEKTNLDSINSPHTDRDYDSYCALHELGEDDKAYFEFEKLKAESDKPQKKGSGKGKTGIHVKQINLNQARKILAGFQKTDPYLVQLVQEFAPENKFPLVSNFNNLTPEASKAYRHVGYVIHGVAQRIVRENS